MKKYNLFLMGAVFVAGSAFGQLSKQVHKVNKFGKMDPASTAFKTSLSPKAGNNNNVLVAPPYAKFSSAMNAFGFISMDQNCLSYNADLNCLALFQRQTEDWPGTAFTPTINVGPTTSPYYSGYQAVKWTTNNGASWDSVNYYQDALNWGRYPSGVIYNPAGNTTLGNGWFVGTGPGVNSSNLWSINWFASVQIPTGAMPRTVQNNDQQKPVTTNTPGSFAQNTYFSPNSTCQAGDTIYTGAFKAHDGPSPGQIYGAAIFKGYFNGTNGFTWKQDSTLANKFTSSGGESDNNAPKIAFSPNGMIGYILVNGSDVAATLPAAQQSYQPMVWKTIDGGAHWNRVNQNYDWVTNHPEIIWNLRSTGDGSITLPSFLDLYGGSITVDVNGKLHYATAVNPASTVDPDSLAFSYNYNFSYQQYSCGDRPWVYDFTTDGNGTWAMDKVTDLFTAKLGASNDADTNAASNIWSNAPDFFDYDNRVRISRSADGTKIFYTWTDSDSTNIMPVIEGSTAYNAYAPNAYPSLFFRGRDANSGQFTPIHENPSAANTAAGGFYFYYPSDIVMTTGSGYRIPVTYLDSRAGNYDATVAVDIYYIDDNDIASGEFNQPAYATCAVGLKEIAGTSVSNVSQNYPNPFSAVSTVKVNLNSSENITLNVSNSIGQLVSTQTVKGNAGDNQLTIDASNLNTGIYFYTVIAGNSKVTRKMSVTK